MAEYIDRKKLLERLVKEYPHQAPHGAIVVGMLCDEEPADVRPVVRGRWIPFTSEAAGDIWYCSACDVGFAHHMDFCPHCGADMREEETNGQKA